MDWVQEPIDGGPQDPYANCPCYGAKCLGRCSPYGMCFAHFGDGCKQLSVCLMFIE